MTHENQDTMMQDVMEALLSQDGNNFANVLTLLLNQVMKYEREQVLNAERYERTESRAGYANGYKPKNLKTMNGNLSLKIPQTRGIPFYPSIIEKGIRSDKALNLAIAEMYVKGVATRKVAKLVEKTIGCEISSSQISRVSSMLDDELDKWRNESLGEYPYLILDATYEDVRIDDSVVSTAVLVAFGINKNGKRSVLGTSVAVSEAEVHWREFLESLVQRNLHGVKYIVSDAHPGLKAARKAVFPGVIWQRCQFHLQQNAQKFAKKVEDRTIIGSEIRSIFNAESRDEANEKLSKLVKKYESARPDFADWLDKNVPESLTVFALPRNQQKKLRTSNMAERQMKEIKRRTKVVMIFPNIDSALRLVSAILKEQDEVWRNSKRYLAKTE